MPEQLGPGPQVRALSQPALFAVYHHGSGPEVGWWEECRCVRSAPRAPKHTRQGHEAWLCFPPFPTLESNRVLGNLVLP